MVAFATLAVSIRCPDVIDNGSLLRVIVGGAVVEPTLLVVLELPLAVVSLNLSTLKKFVHAGQSAKGLACWVTVAAFAWAGTNGTI